MKSKIFIALFVLAAISIILPQCKKLTEQDKVLFNKAKDSAGFTYYKNDSIRASSPESAHNAFFRVRFNATALAALIDNGKLPADSSFPEGSLIVKELYDSQNGSLALLAVMEKATGNSASGANWLWAEFKSDGKLVHSTAKKGDGCISCHSAAGNRDYSRVFDLFP